MKEGIEVGEVSPAPGQEMPPEKEATEDVIAHYKRQLDILIDRVGRLRLKVDDLKEEVGSEAVAERSKLIEMADELFMRADVLRDYVKTFEIQRDIEAGKFGEAKRWLGRLVEKYSLIVPENVSDPLLVLLMKRLKELRQLYHNRIGEESNRINIELLKVEDEINRIAGKILNELK